MAALLVNEGGLVVRNRGIVVGQCPECCGQCGNNYCCQNTGGPVNPPRPWGWPVVVAGPPIQVRFRYSWSASGTMSYANAFNSATRPFNTGLRTVDTILARGNPIGCIGQGDLVTFASAGQFGMRAEVAIGTSSVFANNPSAGTWASGYQVPGGQAIHGVFMRASMLVGSFGTNAAASFSAEDFDGGFWGLPWWSAQYAHTATFPSGSINASGTLGPLNQYGYRTAFASTVAGQSQGGGVFGSETVTINANFVLSLDGIEPCCPTPGPDLGPLLDALQ